MTGTKRFGWGGDPSSDNRMLLYTIEGGIITWLYFISCFFVAPLPTLLDSAEEGCVLP